MNLADSFKAYDVRGIEDETINADVALAVGFAFVAVTGADRVLVGGDMRPSSEDYVAAFTRGAAAAGADVEQLGLISTDMLYHASGVLNAPGVVFTASHNPAGYNGIKMTRAAAVPISADTGLAEIQAKAQSYLDAGFVESVAEAGEVSQRDTLTGYAEYLRSLVDLSNIRPLKVVVDAGNGMAGYTTPAVLGDKVLSSLPIDIIPLYFELDGTFPNHPANPIEPANLVDLQNAVREHGADLGLAFDGDADRCFVIDERGEPVTPSAITAMVAVREIARAQNAGETTPVIIYNLITSKVVPEAVEAAGGRAVETRVGHSFIKAYMAEHSAVFGGEHSAHYYFRDFFNADTGMLAAMHVLAMLGSTTATASSLAAEYTPYVASGEINSQVADQAGSIAQVLAEFDPGVETTISTIDGTTMAATNGDWWFNLRPSNTEPLLRFNAEAADPSTMVWLRDTVLGILRA
ncbi:phosphomannomutase/phosphoglucomutase [Yaniella halotolerans]|uniref:phosphomannomutase/phosphoglucomutase n=1 Tax=Yaniella halotolerans TaxID=225453 RepID=UPI00059395E4|nr:phosphomannomutase/phosphoglucomutase [Yaniella halotolerans]